MRRARYANVQVDLAPCENSSLAIIGRVTLAMRACGASEADIMEFVGDAMMDRDIVGTCRRWITVAAQPAPGLLPSGELNEVEE